MKKWTILLMITTWTCSVAFSRPGSGAGITGDFYGRGDVYTIEDNEYLSEEGNFQASENLPELDEEATLEDYLIYAVMNSPELKAAFHSWKARLEKVPQADAFPDPMFTYTFFPRTIETRVGPQRQKFSFSQTFPWFGNRDLRARAADEAASAEWERLVNLKLQLFLRVKQIYHEYYYLGRSIEITGENLKLLHYLESVVRANYKTGLARYTDVVKAQVLIGELEDRLRSLREMRKPVAAQFNAALNRPAETEVPWPEAIEEPEVTLDELQLDQWLREHNPELKAIGHKAASQAHLLDVADKEDLPSFTLGIDFVDIGPARMPDVPDSGKNALGLRVGLNIPLWRDKYNAGRREAEMQHANILFEKRAKENDLQAALKLAVFEYQDAKRKIRLYKNTLIPKAEESLRVSQKAFTAGNADFLDLIDAQQTLLEYHLAFERAASDSAISIARIEMLVGKDLSEGPSDKDGASEVESNEN